LLDAGLTLLRIFSIWRACDTFCGALKDKWSKAYALLVLVKAVGIRAFSLTCLADGVIGGGNGTSPTLRIDEIITR
jgi:hypothetical protein